MQEENGIVSKICFSCKNEKYINEFYLRNKIKNLREGKCKSCRYISDKKKCSLCFEIIDEEFVRKFDTTKYESLHGFCRSCRKKLRKFQINIGGKVCSKCNLSKTFSDFPHHKVTYDGFDSWCRECRKKYRYEVNQNLDTHIRSCYNRILSDRRKLNFDIDVNYLVSLWNLQEGLCAISKIKMSHKRNKRCHNQYNGSIDRIDSSLGYIKGNVQWVCWNVNRMKGEHSLEDLYLWCEKIIQSKKNTLNF